MWFRQGTLKMKTEKKRETDSQAKIVILERFGWWMEMERNSLSFPGRMCLAGYNAQKRCEDSDTPFVLGGLRNGLTMRESDILTIEYPLLSSFRWFDLIC